LYVEPNFKSKKELKQAVARHTRYLKLIEENLKSDNPTDIKEEFPEPPAEVIVFPPGQGTIPENGTVSLEGPHYPVQHRWYGTGTMKDGVLVEVK